MFLRLFLSALLLTSVTPSSAFAMMFHYCEATGKVTSEPNWLGYFEIYIQEVNDYCMDFEPETTISLKDGMFNHSKCEYNVSVEEGAQLKKDKILNVEYEISKTGSMGGKDSCTKNFTITNKK